SRSGSPLAVRPASRAMPATWIRSPAMPRSGSMSFDQTYQPPRSATKAISFFMARAEGSKGRAHRRGACAGGRPAAPRVPASPPAKPRLPRAWARRTADHSTSGARTRHAPPMYVPAHFREDDPRRLHAVVRAHGFATLVTADPRGEVHVTHLPFV